MPPAGSSNRFAPHPQSRRESLGDGERRFGKKDMMIGTPTMNTIDMVIHTKMGPRLSQGCRCGRGGLILVRRWLGCGGVPLPHWPVGPGISGSTSLCSNSSFTTPSCLRSTAHRSGVRPYLVSAVIGIDILSFQ